MIKTMMMLMLNGSRELKQEDIHLDRRRVAAA